MTPGINPGWISMSLLDWVCLSYIIPLQVSCLKFVGPPSYPALPLPQHPNEKRYQFATPSTLKPTQIRCSEGSINQIPAWAEIKGDIRLTPFYNIHDCMKKFEGYVQELNDGE